MRGHMRGASQASEGDGGGRLRHAWPSPPCLCDPAPLVGSPAMLAGRSGNGRSGPGAAEGVSALGAPPLWLSEEAVEWFRK
jgi:hypothetical protein